MGNPGWRAADVKTVDSFLNALVFSGDALMLAQMIEPRINLEDLDVTARYRNILEYTPGECAIPAPDDTKRLHRIQEGSPLTQCNLIFNRNQHGAAIFVR